jgi:hypothetical protein
LWRSLTMATPLEPEKIASDPSLRMTAPFGLKRKRSLTISTGGGSVAIPLLMLRR